MFVDAWGYNNLNSGEEVIGAFFLLVIGVHMYSVFTAATTEVIKDKRT